MTATHGVPLLGFVSLGPDDQGFLLPIFGDADHPLIQDADDERIQRFRPCYFPPTTKLLPSNERDHRAVGELMLYAFQLARGIILKGTKDELQIQLKPHLAYFSSFPYLHSEIAAFLEDAREQSRRDLEALLENFEAEEKRIREDMERIRKQLSTMPSEWKRKKRKSKKDDQLKALEAGENAGPDENRSDDWPDEE